jgi:hypothetical protein
VAWWLGGGVRRQEALLPGQKNGYPKWGRGVAHHAWPWQMPLRPREDSTPAWSPDPGELSDFLYSPLFISFNSISAMISSLESDGEAQSTCQRLMEGITALIDQELPQVTGVARPLLRIEATVCLETDEPVHLSSSQRRLLVCLWRLFD